MEQQWERQWKWKCKNILELQPNSIQQIELSSAEDYSLGTVLVQKYDLNVKSPVTTLQRLPQHI